MAEFNLAINFKNVDTSKEKNGRTCCLCTTTEEIFHKTHTTDVMIFFDGQVNSLHNISLTLDRFTVWSGLTVNISKTELYVAGLTQLETDDLTALGFSAGALPVRYLGLPLMHRKLHIRDYRPLN